MLVVYLIKSLFIGKHLLLLSITVTMKTRRTFFLSNPLFQTILQIENLLLEKTTLSELLLATRSTWCRVKKPELNGWCTVHVLLISSPDKWALVLGGLLFPQPSAQRRQGCTPKHLGSQASCLQDWKVGGDNQEGVSNETYRSKAKIWKGWEKEERSRKEFSLFFQVVELDRWKWKKRGEWREGERETYLENVL